MTVVSVDFCTAHLLAFQHACRAYAISVRPCAPSTVPCYALTNSRCFHAGFSVALAWRGWIVSCTSCVFNGTVFYTRRYRLLYATSRYLPRKRSRSPCRRAFLYPQVFVSIKCPPPDFFVADRTANTTPHVLYYSSFVYSSVVSVCSL